MYFDFLRNTSINKCKCVVCTLHINNINVVLRKGFVTMTAHAVASYREAAGSKPGFRVARSLEVVGEDGARSGISFMLVVDLFGGAVIIQMDFSLALAERMIAVCRNTKVVCEFALFPRTFRDPPERLRQIRIIAKHDKDSLPIADGEDNPLERLGDGLVNTVTSVLQHDGFTVTPRT